MAKERGGKKERRKEGKKEGKKEINKERSAGDPPRGRGGGRDGWTAGEARRGGGKRASAHAEKEARRHGGMKSSRERRTDVGRCFYERRAVCVDVNYIGGHGR